MDEPLWIAACCILLIAAVAVTTLYVRQRHYAAALHTGLAAAAAAVKARDDEIQHLLDARLPAVLSPECWSEGIPGPLDPDQLDRLRPVVEVFAAEMRKERWLRTLDQERQHLIAARLPAVFAQLSDPDVRDPGPRYPEHGDLFEPVVEGVAGQLSRARDTANSAATATIKALMRAVQNLANAQQELISTAQHQHADPAVLADLLEIDRWNSQLARRAQAVGALCGAWPGLNRSAKPLTDVVRGAMSRIRDYIRVSLDGESDTLLTSRAVEPVALAVAELLDNAARHSPPQSTVCVNVWHAHNGMSIVIDDAGHGMTRETARLAAQLLGHRPGYHIADLGEPPRIGLAAVGVLATRYGFTASVDTHSPFGGTRAVVFLPFELLVDSAAPAQPQPAAVAEPTPVWPASDTGGLTPSSLPAPRGADTTTASGLPIRQRRHDGTAPQPHRTWEGRGAGQGPLPTTMTAWARGTKSGRASAITDR